MERTASRRGPGFMQALGTFVLGAATGSIVALLYAPAAGRTTRKRLKVQFRALQRSAIALRDTAARKISYARKWVRSRVTPQNGRRLATRHAVQHA